LLTLANGRTIDVMRQRGSVFKRCDHPKNGWTRCSHAWTVVVSAGNDVAGNPRQVWRTVRGSREDANRELTKLLHDRDEGRLASAQSLTVETYLIEQWLPHQKTRIRDSTWHRYDELVRGYVLPVAGGTKLQRLRPIDVQRVVDSMLKQGRAPRTVVQAYRVLSSSLTQAVRWQLIATNPAAAVKPPRVERATLDVPDREAVLAIMEAAKGSWLETPLFVAATTGIRRGELIGLRWREVDLKKGLLRITAAVQRVDGDLVLVEPKSAMGRRTVGIPEMTVTVLGGVRTEQAKRRLLLGEAWRDLDLVIERGDGAPVDPDSLTHAFRTLVRSIGRSGVRLHDLRHAYATALLRADVHPKIVSEALGHSSTAFTMDTYSHVIPSMQQAAAAAIEQALGESP
jgi:integrase